MNEADVHQWAYTLPRSAWPMPGRVLAIVQARAHFPQEVIPSHILEQAIDAVIARAMHPVAVRLRWPIEEVVMVVTHDPTLDLEADDERLAEQIDQSLTAWSRPPAIANRMARALGFPPACTLGEQLAQQIPSLDDLLRVWGLAGAEPSVQNGVHPTLSGWTLDAERLVHQTADGMTVEIQRRHHWGLTLCTADGDPGMKILARRSALAGGIWTVRIPQFHTVTCPALSRLWQIDTVMHGMLARSLERLRQYTVSTDERRGSTMLLATRCAHSPGVREDDHGHDS